MPINVKNVGNSPALKVRVRADVIPAAQQMDVDAKQKSLCSEASTDYLFGEGDAIFPGDGSEEVEPIHSKITFQALRSELTSPSSNTFTSPNGVPVEIL